MNIIDNISSLIIPVVILAFALLLFRDKNEYFNSFLEGAMQGLKTTVNLIPTMVLLLVALSMLSASGATAALTKLLAPIGEKIGVPSEILPLLLTRPVSGSAANAAYTKLLGETGADSFPSFAASVIMGSSDTLIYVISVYFSGAVGVKNTRHAFPVALCVMLFCIFFSCFIARLFYL